MNVFMLMLGLLVVRPDSLSLQRSYQALQENYPLIDKIELEQKITRLNEANTHTGYFPQVTLNGMTSYQSDVTEVPFSAPGTNPVQFSKDHYKLSVDVEQPIYNGGAVGIRQSLDKVQGSLGEESVNVSMHQLRRQVDQVYFSILTLRNREASIKLVRKDLQKRLDVIQSKVKNGVVTPGAAYALKAELLKTEQSLSELRANVRAAADVMSELTGLPVDEQTVLSLPPSSVEPGGSLPEQRPEYAVFNSRTKSLDLQKDLVSARQKPKLAAFGTAAYGRPGLNAFSDDLQSYYIVGLRAKWNFWTWFNGRREKETLDLQQQKLKADKTAFSTQLRANAARKLRDVEKLKQLIDHDSQVVALREKVTKESASRLDNGVITSSEYVNDLYAEHRARLAQQIHRIQLVQTKIEYQTLLGLSWK